jgi:hypothetical protein
MSSLRKPSEPPKHCRVFGIMWACKGSDGQTRCGNFYGCGGKDCPDPCKFCAIWDPKNPN